jgi:hypothetical protein
MRSSCESVEGCEWSPVAVADDDGAAAALLKSARQQYSRERRL